MRTHDCPVCRASGVPYRHATCVTCWPAVPGPIRIRLVAAWYRRQKDPGAHRDALAELLAWARDRRAVAPQ